MNLIFLVILVGTAFVAWWLSGYDGMVTGENRLADLKRRITRCAITVLLIAIGVGALLGNTRFGGFIAIALVLPLALIWVGCASELMAQTVHGLIDSPSAPESDPKKLAADLDRLAALFADGLDEEAIKLCTKLVESQEGSGLAMEAMLFRLYDRVFADDRLLSSPALAEANRLATGGYNAEAESRLNLLTEREPGNLSAVLMLMRVYAQHLHSPEKAYGLAQDLDDRIGVPPFFANFARQRITAWLKPDSREAESTEGIESLLVDKSRLNRSRAADRSSETAAD